MAEKLLMYGIGRNVQYYDAPAVRAIVREAAASNNYKFASLVLGVVKSAPFQMRAQALKQSRIGARRKEKTMTFITKKSLPRRTFCEAWALPWRCRCWIR